MTSTRGLASLVVVPALAAVFALVLPASSAWAARSATVDLDGVELRDKPNGSVIGKLSKGMPLSASNMAIDGYFKVRTGDGRVGFVPADSLNLAPPAQEDIPAQSAPSSISEAPKPTLATESGFRGKTSKKRIRVRVLGGYTFFSVGDVNNQLGGNVLVGGYHLGGEFAVMFTQDLAFVARAEQISKNVFAQDQKTLKSFEISTSSLPVTVGLDLALTSGPKWSIRFSLLAGLGLATGLKAVDVSDPAPNVTEMSSIAFTGTAAFDAIYALNKSWSVFAEAGYRYLQTGQMTPSTIGTGSEIFQVPNTGNYAPMAVSLSGPFVSGGAGFSF